MKASRRKVLNKIDSNKDLDPNLLESKEERRKSRKSILLCSDDEEEFDDSDDYRDSSDDEEEEDYDTAIGIKPRSKNSKKLCIGDEDDDDDDDDDDYLSPLEHDDKENKKSANEKRKDHPDSIIKTKKKSMQKQSIDNSGRGGGTKKTPNPKPRKRRRSSARFLRLSGRFEEDDDEEVGMDGGNNFVGGESQEEQQEKLGEMYRQAIRLNAENKINVGNSWGLNLIDNIDKFLGDEDEDGISMDQTPKSNSLGQDQNSDGQQQQQQQQSKQQGENSIKRVNFTRASCTLDASVKIYSYRVDDVHLTSYKVLANLNRTDGGKEKKQDLFDDGGDTYGEEEQELRKRKSLVDESRRNGKRSTVDTLESNLSNINVSKLDAAYDIDPIFHKMSQKFDEGGAKGLLLVNLGVASDGCRIVLDSKEDTTETINDENVMQENNSDDKTVSDIDDEKMNEPSEQSIAHSNSGTEYLHEEGEIDISELSNKLQELLLCSPLDTIQLVPQLEELRTAYVALEEEGFTDKSKVEKLKSKRYANDEEEERAAEKCIQREAFERSRASGIQSMSILAPNMSMFTTASNVTPTDDENENQYAPDDYGGGFDDFDDDDHGDQEFDNFIATNDSEKKYSSTSFVENEMTQDEFPSYSSEKASNTTFLDAVCTGDALNNGGEYNYFDANTLDTMVTGNQWAGSAHWKKSVRLRTKPKRYTPSNSNEEEPKKKDQKRKKRKETKDTKSKVLIDLKSCHQCLDDLVKQNKKTRGKKSSIDQSQFTKAMLQKHTKERNILPQDAEISIRQFSTLFMRPNAMVSDLNVAPSVSRKSVGFVGADAIPFDDGIDDSYDDGPGFELAGNDDGNFVEMDDYVVKDLEDVRKVDKVRVKHATVAKKVDVKRLKKDLWSEVEVRTRPQLITDVEEEQNGNDSEMSSIKGNSESPEISFKNVVEDLGANETQEDVSLAFYFICVLHLANEKCLKLENGEYGLNDFVITRDEE